MGRASATLRINQDKSEYFVTTNIVYTTQTTLLQNNFTLPNKDIKHNNNNTIIYTTIPNITVNIIFFNIKT